MSAVAAIRARAREYSTRMTAAEDAAQAQEDRDACFDHRLEAISHATVAITLYEIAEALEQDGDE